MCFFGSKTPKPPPVPTPPSPREEGLVAQQDELRRRQRTAMSRSGTVLTSPMGDSAAGNWVGAPRATGGSMSGTSLGGSMDRR